MLATAIVAVVMSIVGVRLQRYYRERQAIAARLAEKQRLIRALGPASTPQEELWPTRRRR